MLSVSYAGKNAYSAGKTSGLLRVDASGANRCYVLAHCAPPPPLIKIVYILNDGLLDFWRCIQGVQAQKSISHPPFHFEREKQDQLHRGQNSIYLSAVDVTVPASKLFLYFAGPARLVFKTSNLKKVV